MRRLFLLNLFIGLTVVGLTLTSAWAAEKNPTQGGTLIVPQT